MKVAFTWPKLLSHIRACITFSNFRGCAQVAFLRRSHYADRWCRWLPLVDLPTMADPENQYHKPVVFQGANEAIISYAVSPEPAQCALEPPSDCSWIVQFFDALV
jgi:hypothetical protein